jgi:hypothetical protein
VKRVFLLSPANCNGVRAGWILRRNARSDIAKRLRDPEGVPLAEVYSFLSALYFRGKLTYARAFANPPLPSAGVMIITPTAGLMPDGATVRLSTLRGFSRVPINVKNRRYRTAFLRGLRQLARDVGPDCEVILLGSIASGKYLDLVQQVFADQLRVPAEFIGLGDMSRGALLLQCVKERRELNYISVATVSNRRPLPATLETAQPVVKSTSVSS